MSGSIDQVRDAAGVCRITLNRPAKRNALTHALMAELGNAIISADADDKVHVILLDALGPSFCTGADLSNLGEELPTGEDPGHSVLKALAAATKPTVAAVQGAAVGMGATMLLHFDVIVAAPDASIHMPFVALGLTPEGGATFLLPARVGAIRAARLLLCAEAMTATEALAAGLITSVVAHEELACAALSTARRLAGLPPVAIRQCKAMLRAPDLLDRMDDEQRLFRAALSGPEFSDAIAGARDRLSRK